MSSIVVVQEELARWHARLGTPVWLIAACLAIFAIALVARLTLLAALGYQPAIDFAEMENLARTLAESGTLGDPYKLPTGPSAHHAPVYPALLAGIFLLWGYGASAAWAMTLMNLTFASLHYAMLPLLARVARLPIVPVAAAALVGAGLPFRILKEVRWEASLVALAMVMGVTISIWWRRDVLPSYGRSVVAGAAWGLFLLAAPGMLPVLLLLIAWWALSAFVERRRSWLPRLAVLLLTTGAVLLPWTVRNYRALGGVVFVRSNFGIEFSVSNHDAAHMMARDNILIGFPNNYFHENHPYSSRAHAARVRRIGEIAYNRERLAHALAWCYERPGRFGQLMLARFGGFWAMPTRTQPWKDAMLQPITVLGLAGLFVLWRRDRQVGAVFAAVLVGYPLVYYFVQIDSRYRYPIDWVLLLLAAYTAAALAARLQAGRTRSLSKGQPSPAAASSLLKSD